MITRIECKSAYSVAYIFLSSGEEVHLESGALLAFSSGVTARPGTSGGVVKAAFRKVLAQEKFFMTKFQSEVDGAWVCATSKYPGDMDIIELSETGPIMLQSGSLVAVEPSVVIDVRYAGIDNIILREGATTIEATGVGQVIISSYGAIQEYPINAGESVVIDTGHIVAWTVGLQMQVGTLGSLVTAVTSGEGMVARYTARETPGKVWIQTRSEDQLKSWILPGRSQNEKSGN